MVPPAHHSLQLYDSRRCTEAANGHDQDEMHNHVRLDDTVDKFVHRLALLLQLSQPRLAVTRVRQRHVQRASTVSIQQHAHALSGQYTSAMDGLGANLIPAVRQHAVAANRPSTRAGSDLFTFAVSPPRIRLAARRSEGRRLPRLPPMTFSSLVAVTSG